MTKEAVNLTHGIQDTAKMVSHSTRQLLGVTNMLLLLTIPRHSSGKNGSESIEALVSGRRFNLKTKQTS